MCKTQWREKELLALDYLKARLAELPTELSSAAWLGGEVNPSCKQQVAFLRISS